jgi:glycosyltransferase involved in cell wall biosynthesis
MKLSLEKSGPASVGDMNGSSEEQSSTNPTAADTPRRLKVCHIAATTEGATWMLEQLRELRDRHQCEVTAVVAGESGGLINLLRAENIPYHVESFSFGSVKGIFEIARTIFRLTRFFRRERFDVIQTHLFFSMIIGRIAAWLADVPVRLGMLTGPFILQAATSRWIERATCWMDTGLIPSCECSMQLYQSLGVKSERLTLVYYAPDEVKFSTEDVEPLDLRAEFGWPPGTPLIGKVAYFYPPLSGRGWIPEYLEGRGVKGHEDLINAAPLVLAEFPEAKFLLVGSGWGEAGDKYMEELKEIVREMGLERSIIFTGYRREANRILRSLDVAVQASLNENLGGTMEALLMECPMVVTRVGGMVDAVRDGETGVVVEPSCPQDMARGLLQMLRVPEQARSLGRAGRRLMLERFTLRHTAHDLNELYRCLLSREEKRRAFYNPLVSLLRLIAFIPVLIYLTFRLFVIDIYLHIYLPIHLARLRSIPYRLYSKARPFLPRMRGPLRRSRAFLRKRANHRTEE